MLPSFSSKTLHVQTFHQVKHLEYHEAKKNMTKTTRITYSTASSHFKPLISLACSACVCVITFTFYTASQHLSELGSCMKVNNQVLFLLWAQPYLSAHRNHPLCVLGLCAQLRVLHPLSVHLELCQSLKTTSTTVLHKDKYGNIQLQYNTPTPVLYVKLMLSSFLHLNNPY